MINSQLHSFSSSSGSITWAFWERQSLRCHPRPTQSEDEAQEDPRWILSQYSLKSILVCYLDTKPCFCCRCFKIKASIKVVQRKGYGGKMSFGDVAYSTLPPLSWKTHLSKLKMLKNSCSRYTSSIQHFSNMSDQGVPKVYLSVFMNICYCPKEYLLVLTENSKLRSLSQSTSSPFNKVLHLLLQTSPAGLFIKDF